MQQVDIEENRKVALERLKRSRESVPGPRLGPSPINETAKKFCKGDVHMAALITQLGNNGRKPKKNQELIAKYCQSLITCTSEMVTETHFQFLMNGFHEKLIAVFKTIPSKIYDPTKRIWKFHLNDYMKLINSLEALGLNLRIEKIPAFVIKFCKEAKDAPVESCLRSIQPKLLETLMTFQKDGVCFGIQKKGRCMIADEMGLGKTYQALAIADFYRDDLPLLVCTTATTRNVWQKKIMELLPYIPCQSIITLTTTKDYFADAKVVITSYALMEKNCDKLLKMKFGIAIMDESHSLKNHKAKCTIVAQKLATIAKRVILLTGTPALSRPAELFTQIQILCKNAFNYKEFTSRYCEGHETDFGWNATGQANLTELNVILHKKFMIRRIKNEVMKEFADKNRELVELDVDFQNENSENVESLNAIAEELKLTQTKKDHNMVLLRYYTETATIKTRAVCNYILELLKGDNKFIVFAHHIVMLDAITGCLEQKDVNYIRIDGSTRNDIRSKHIDYFQKHDQCRVAVLSLKACNSGITLTAAKMVVFAELDWNPSTLTQAESRAHRIGQEDDVVVKYLLAKGTCDDVIWSMLITKQNVLNKAGLCHEDFSDTATTSYTLQNQTHGVSSCKDMMSTFVASECDNMTKLSAASGLKVEQEGNVCDNTKHDVKPVEESESGLNDMFNDGNDDIFANLNY